MITAREIGPSEFETEPTTPQLPQTPQIQVCARNTCINDKSLKILVAKNSHFAVCKNRGTTEMFVLSKF